MSVYADHCLPGIINLACGTKAITRIRAEVVPLAEGRVLEIGVGGGLNLPFYDPGKVDCICGVEPSAAMRKKAGKAAQGIAIPVELLPDSAEELQLAEGSFDTVVLTFTLCTIPHWRVGLAEMRRVLKPQGKLIFCEHGLAPESRRQWWQRTINPCWKVLAGGCNLDRPIPDLIREGGFVIETLEAGYAAGLPRFAGYIYRGTALKPEGKDVFNP